MEKISLFLLLAKKSLIGTVIAGMLGIGALPSFFDNKVKNENDGEKIEKSIKDNPYRETLPRS